jgi:hypothetical protein
MIDWAKFDFGPLAARAAAKQAAQSTRTTTAQETRNDSEIVALSLPVSQASVVFTPGELAVAIPADAAVPVATPPVDVSTPAASKQECESDAEFTQSSVSQEKETVPLLSIANHPISRHDSPNSPSNESASETEDYVIGGTSGSQDIITDILPGQATESEPTIGQEAPTGTFSKLRQTLPGFEGSGRDQMISHEPGVPGNPAMRPNKSQPRVFRREEDVLDWDDSDL